jgi:hypothetical protein
MTPPNDAERALYADLTALIQHMRGAPYASVEAAVEERFQAFLRAHRAGASACLEITQTMTVHDDAEPWAVYRTEYRVRSAEPPAPAVDPADTSSVQYSNVVPFPAAFARRTSAFLAEDAARTLRTP